MPNLRDFVLANLANAGYQPHHLNLVLWDTQQEFAAGGSSWVPVDRHQFSTLAATIDVADVAPAARERLRFMISDDEGGSGMFQWSNDDARFIKVPERPRIITLTAEDLTT